jgi:glyoxalase family protein
MEKTILGIHHVTAIAAAPQLNLDFYVGFFGLRLVKKTVNFDDPGTYHFYYGDETGTPGSILTFFPWPGARRGRHGSGQAAVTSFAVPKASISRWQERARKAGVSIDPVTTRFGEEVLGLRDPDGLQLELIGSLEGGRDAIVKIHSATIANKIAEPTVQLLTETMGFRLSGEEGDRLRYEVAGGGPGAIVDILPTPDLARGIGGAGTVHHIAWRTPDGHQQLRWQQRLMQLDYHVSPVMDRQYFQSIYFREPGGILFEIATDPPGFTVDEPVESLGTGLMLPPNYEKSRRQIELGLPPVTEPVRM